MQKLLLSLIPVFIISIFAASCNTQMYYSRVKRHVGDFDNAMNEIQTKQLLAHYDTILLKDGQFIVFDGYCLYAGEVTDSLINAFMRKYNLDRICFSRQHDKFFDSSIVFCRDYNPILGKAVTVHYDFGKSGFRDSVEAGVGINKLKVKVLIKDYLYCVNPHPAFGE